ncbi:MAG TPA: hypothetical protein DEF51_52475, partial [Myxococcales bacterium]|nr:hypothetical protein [Myxococcales bacterium]
SLRSLLGSAALGSKGTERRRARPLSGAPSSVGSGVGYSRVTTRMPSTMLRPSRERHHITA